MRGTICSISFYILLTTFFLQQSRVNCYWNKGDNLDCIPYKVQYQNFRVDFYFSSRSKRNQLYTPSVALRRTNIDFDPRRRTAVLIHGFLGSGQDKYIKSLSDNLLTWKNMNVISVEWTEGCSNPLKYVQAAANTEFVAIKIRELFRTLIGRRINTPQSVNNWGPVHFIGHSLGAHIAGQAANLLRRINNLTIDRITGLDPAAPCFENAEGPLRLKSTDAKFVDVIHTDGATVDDYGFGLNDVIGHADFYVNGGSIQPGCPVNQRKSLQVIGLTIHTLRNGACHHIRALELFTESVNQASSNGCHFWGRPWHLNSTDAETKEILQQSCWKFCVEMGINAENYHSLSKTFYVETTGNPPYCKEN